MGFGAEIQSKERKDVGELLAMVQPEDLIKYGLIPEFVGRQITATSSELTEDALVQDSYRTEERSDQAIQEAV